MNISVKELKEKESSKVEEISWNISNRMRELGNTSVYGGFCLSYVAYLSSNMLFRISIYRVISSEILHNMAALKLCYAIIKNEIVLKTEIQTLLVCLLKLQDETVIKQTDSEQEALYKLRCRIISCKIAKELYVRGIKSDIVDGWKRISENKNEFIEIRNVVFDTTGDE